jgi:hypothetical protein
MIHRVVLHHDLEKNGVLKKARLFTIFFARGPIFVSVGQPDMMHASFLILSKDEHSIHESKSRNFKSGRDIENQVNNFNARGATVTQPFQTTLVVEG